jgi:SAM-dependent methyltransferase
MDTIYRDLGIEAIPWNIEDPPDTLVELIESGRVRPCDAVDLGCGLGNHALWLATLGFRVTGIDLSEEAVSRAEQVAADRGIDCTFLVLDLSVDMVDLNRTFDLAYDWKVLHHVFPERRAAWARNVHSLLRPGGTYVSVCFSDAEPTGFPGNGKYRTTPLGTTLYLSSEDEIRAVFEERFELEVVETIIVPGKSQPHTAVKCVMVRRD